MEVLQNAGRLLVTPGGTIRQRQLESLLRGDGVARFERVQDVVICTQESEAADCERRKDGEPPRRLAQAAGPGDRHDRDRQARQQEQDGELRPKRETEGDPEPDRVRDLSPALARCAEPEEESGRTRRRRRQVGLGRPCLQKCDRERRGQRPGQERPGTAGAREARQSRHRHRERQPGCPLGDVQSPEGTGQGQDPGEDEGGVRRHLVHPEVGGREVPRRAEGRPVVCPRQVVGVRVSVQHRVEEREGEVRDGEETDGRGEARDRPVLSNEEEGRGDHITRGYEKPGGSAPQPPCERRQEEHRLPGQEASGADQMELGKDLGD